MGAAEARGLAFELCRVTLELDSPLRIGAGRGDELLSAPFVVDANGLPALPGTSLVGVLRHLVASDGRPETTRLANEVFGFQQRDVGSSSRVEVSWAQVHGQDDRPVPMRAARLVGDDVLGYLAAGASRDHVRVNGHGVVDGDGKYEVIAVPAGARFTFEIIVHSSSALSASILLGLLHGPAARLGGSTRRGLGAFHLVRAQARTFDLTRADDRAALRRLPRGLHERPPDSLLRDLAISTVAPVGIAMGKIALTPEDLWLVGGGDPDAIDVRNSQGDPVAIAPLQERRIRWQAGQAVLGEPEFLLPASALKGALRHRTAFHVRRLLGSGHWAPQSCPDATTAPPGVDALFGSLKEEEGGTPGRLFFGDAWPAGVPSPVDHVSIDRFSGGPMDGCLFTEAPVLGVAFEVPLALDLRGGEDLANENNVVLPALRAALQDLCRGRLALGGGAARGHGYMSGRVSWEGVDPLEGAS